MNIRNFSTLLSLLCLLFLSCKEKNTKIIIHPKIIIPLLGNKTAVNISTSDSIITPLTLTSLNEKNDSTFLTGLDKLIIKNGIYYILDKKFSQLHEYTLDGKFIRSIGNVGLGVGQYKRIADFDISPDGKEISILSNEDQAIFCYDLSGVFKQKITLEIFCYNFSYIPNGNGYLIYSNFNTNANQDNNNVFLINRRGEITDRYFPYNHTKSTTSILFSGFLIKSNDQIYFERGFDEFVYQWGSRSSFRPLARVLINGSYTNEHQDEIDSVLTMQAIKKNQGGYLGNRFFRNNFFTVFTFTSLNRLKTAIYNNNSAKLKIIDRGIPDPLIILLGNPVYLSADNELYFAESPQIILNALDKIKNKKPNKNWSRLLAISPKIHNFYLLKVKLN